MAKKLHWNVKFTEFTKKQQGIAKEVEKDFLKRKFKISISLGNEKIGHIHSFSLPPLITCCCNCGCAKDKNGKVACYACHGKQAWRCTMYAYAKNLYMWKHYPEETFRQINADLWNDRFFRFSVAGDIPDPKYFEYIVEAAKNNGHCQIMMFTKKYKIVNDWIDSNGDLPPNLKVIFSIWKDFPCDNKHELPEAHVVYEDGTTTAREDAHKCGGNCETCSKAGAGCWVLKKGEQVVFNEH